MNPALSPNGRRLLRVLFGLVVVFLYAPIAILFLFSFNDSVLPTFPLSGFTFTWYRQFAHDSELLAALQTSALVALLSSVGAVILGTLASVALARRRFRGRAAVSALLLSPLVIPYVVLGIALLLLFHTANVPRSILTVVIGHIVISVPYAILVLARGCSRSTSRSRRRRTTSGPGRSTRSACLLPLILPAIFSAFLIALTTSFDEYAVASFVIGPRITFPIYLYGALRFPSRLPEVIAVAVVVITVSLVVVIGAEIVRRRVERRLGALDAV